MLTELHIQNIAVIQKASIPFAPGLNVFTGETGAGKTILISAIDAVLGERTSRDIIRSGEEKAQVSALFENISPKTKAVLEELGYEIEDDNVLIFREMTTAGRNTCRINGMPATVTLIKQISQYLINIHGQRDTGQLVSPEQHLTLIDDYGELEQDVNQYSQQFDGLRKLKKQLAELDMDESQKLQRIEMLKFQIEEIQLAGLEDPLEEDKLMAHKKLVAGSERVRRNLSDATSAYYGGEMPGIDELMDTLMQGVENASQYMEDMSAIFSRLEELNYELADIGRDIKANLDTLDFDPGELDEIERRLDTIYKLKRKYGASIEEILTHHASAVEELETMTLSEERQAKLEKDILTQQELCTDLASKLSRKRAIACKGFIKGVEAQLGYLDMPNVRLSVEHVTTELSKTGTDQLQFMIITNLGEQPKPLGKIASGGELARIMLAIKDVLADKDNIDTLIFDEIDTGVSGKAAGKVGRKLSEVSKDRQVICVTHLAQVAAFADNHLYIHKEEKDNRTFTIITQLDGEGSVRELARITSGEVVTKAALETARELISRAGKPYNGT